MRSALKYIFLSILTGACLAITGDLCQKQTKGFRLQNILAKGSYEEPIELIPDTKMQELKEILSQPFTFFKKGQQCFVFLSQDKKYVIKLFRWDKLQASSLEKLFAKNAYEKKEKKRELDFTSYKIAWNNLKEETGLVFLQLGKRDKVHISITLYDRIGIKHSISTSDIGFILQKKADDFYPIFREGKEDLKPFFSSLSSLLQSRVDKGISDSDISLEYNMGILEGKPILFDIGNLTKKETSVKDESALILKTLEKKAPELMTFLSQDRK
jgi:hypothetical protein